MKTFSKLAGVVTGALLVAAGSSFAQTEPIDPFTALKPGQWVKIKGISQQDTALAATEVKILTGKTAEDDWEVAAPLHRIVDESQKHVELFGIQVKVQSNATYKSSDKSLSGFESLKPGMQIEAEGTYANGVLTCKEVQLEKTSNEPAKLVGKVEKIDADAKTITLMGIPCLISESTKVRASAN